VKNLKHILILVIILMLILLSVQNAEFVTIKFLFWSFATSRIVMILLLFAIGFLAGHLVANLNQMRKKKLK